MKYRKFGSLDWEASVLGFGAMRLPVLAKDASRVDESEAIKMMRLYTKIPGRPASCITILQKRNRLTTVSSALNVKKNALREFQFPSSSKKRMPGWTNKAKFWNCKPFKLCRDKSPSGNRSFA